MSIAIEEIPAPSVAARPAPTLRRHFFGAHHYTLLAIIIFGGILRFTRLAHPPLWIDEGLTFWRVCGDYQGLINSLRIDGFVPLHYTILWWIRQGMPLGPFK